MKQVLLSISISITLLASSLSLPFTAFADTYGSGNYGGCAYSTGCTSSSSNIVSSASNAVSTFFCTNQAPSSAPNLYEIDVTSTTAGLYFSPAGGPYDSHYISYGQGNSSEGFGINLSTSQSPGADYYKIQELSPNTIYTFKVRGGNGCKPGPWSNMLTIQTLPRGSRTIKKFYPNQQAQYVQAPQANFLTQVTNFVTDHLPSAPNTGLAPAVKQHISPTTQTMSKSQGVHTNLSPWSTIVNFFTGIFHSL